MQDYLFGSSAGEHRQRRLGAQCFAVLARRPAGEVAARARQVDQVQAVQLTGRAVDRARLSA